MWTNQDHDKIWLKQSWSGSDLDKLYLGATGVGSNSDRGALLITSNNGVLIGKGNDSGTQLSEVNAKVEENGDLWLRGRVK